MPIGTIVGGYFGRGFGMRSMILGLLLLTANVAHAETGDDVFTIGVGHNSCGQLIAAIGNTP